MLTWFFLLLFLAIGMAAGGLALRSYLTGEAIGGFFFAPRPERRLAVIEHAAVDNRRRLILLRRDGVEHLIMTGGPVDLVIETGIGAATAASPARASSKADPDTTTSTPVFSRPPRALGQVVNE